jgi:hypothetical protein
MCYSVLVVDWTLVNCSSVLSLYYTTVYRNDPAYRRPLCVSARAIDAGVKPDDGRRRTKTSSEAERNKTIDRCVADSVPKHPYILESIEWIK